MHAAVFAPKTAVLGRACIADHGTDDCQHAISPYFWSDAHPCLLFIPSTPTPTPTLTLALTLPVALTSTNNNTPKVLADRSSGTGVDSSTSRRTRARSHFDKTVHYSPLAHNGDHCTLLCSDQSCATHALRYDSVQQRISVRSENLARASVVCVFSRQALPATAYKAAIKALEGPDNCTAALELAREARAKLGDSAEVHVGRELMYTMEIHDLYRWFIPFCGLSYYSCSYQDLVCNTT